MTTGHRLLCKEFLRFNTMPGRPTNIVPTNIAGVKLSGKSPMNLGIPPLRIKIMLESNPPKPTMLVGGLGVRPCPYTSEDAARVRRCPKTRKVKRAYMYI